MRPQRRQPTRLRHPWDSPGKKTGVGCHFLLQSMNVKSESEVAQSCPTLSDPMDCSAPGPSVHGIFQARKLEWAAISFSRGSSQPRSPALQTDALLSEPPRKPHLCMPLSNLPTLVRPVSCTTITRKLVICFLSLQISWHHLEIYINGIT